MFSSGFLSASKRQLVEEAVNCGKIGIDSVDRSYLEGTIDFVEQFIQPVAKAFVVDTVMRLVELSKAAPLYAIAKSKPISSLTEHFILLAKAYLSLINTDQFPSKSRNLAMTLIFNASLPQKVFVAVMCSLIAHSKESAKHITLSISFSDTKVETLTKPLSAVNRGLNIVKIPKHAK